METSSSRELTVSTLVLSVTAILAYKAMTSAAANDQQPSGSNNQCGQKWAGEAVPSEAIVRNCAGPSRWIRYFSNCAY